MGILIVRQVFKNKDGSTRILNLICSDLSLDGPEVAALYKKRWNVEVFHKSLKLNAGLEKSPMTQIDRVFLSILAVFKLEHLKIRHKKIILFCAQNLISTVYATLIMLWARWAPRNISSLKKR